MGHSGYGLVVRTALEGRGARAWLPLVALLVVPLAAAGLAAFPVSAQTPGQIAHLGPGGAVWLTDVESGETKQLAEGPAFSSLDWAPDGQMLVLVVGGSLADGHGEVYTLEVESRQLTKVDDGYAPVWSRDGQHILYVSDFTLREEGTEQSLSVHSLTDDAGRALVTQRWVSGLWPVLRVAYSHDERFIAVYVAGLEMEGHLVIVDGEGSTVWEIPDFVYSADGFDWSPDSPELVYRDSGEPFMGGEAPALKIVRVDAQQTVQAFEQSGFWPRWSPDGERIAALVWAEGSVFRVMMVDPREPESMLVSDQVFGDIWNSQLRWSPDGSALLFTSVEEGQGQVHVMERGGSVASIAEGQNPQVFWSPDSSHIAMAVGAGEARELFVMAADGSGLRKVADGWMPVWRPIAEGEPAAAPVCALPIASSMGVVLLALATLRTRRQAVDGCGALERGPRRSALA